MSASGDSKLGPDLEARLRTLMFRYPTDADVRALYADVLIANGDPRGRFIRAQSALDGRLPPDARETARHEVRSLLGAHEKSWSSIASWADVRFKGGFIDAIRATIGSFLGNATALFALEPVQKVVLGAVSNAELKKLAEHEALARIQYLSLSGSFGDEGLTALVKSKWSTSLRGLTLAAHGEMGEGFFSEIGALRSLASLSLPGMEIGDELVALLAKAPLEKLERLYLARNAISDEGIGALAAASWPALARLCIGGNEMGDEGAEALAKAKFGSVTHLEINQNSVGDEGVLAIVKGKAFRGLRKINIRQTEVSNEGARKLRERKGLTVIGPW